MQAEIVIVDQYDDGKYDWDEEAIILTPSSITERTFLESILKRNVTRVSLRIFDAESHAKWVKTCEENRAKKLLEDKQSEGVETPNE